MKTSLILWDIERRLWMEGLPEAERYIDRDAFIILPDPIGALVGKEISRRLRDMPRWRGVFFEKTSCWVRENVAVLSYRASAVRTPDDRAQSPSLITNCASSYSRSAKGWKLIAHQQGDEALIA
ncbi:MAG: hypothetical protein MRY63_08580 [Neomegalonema sp.]|nr:hypothetical protein [Neomegalonema sp.]